MREINKITNMDNPYAGTEPPNLLEMMMKIQDHIVLGIPYKKNRSARLQKKMQKIVRSKNIMPETTYTIAQRALNGGKDPETVYICDECETSNGTIRDIATMAPFQVPPEYLCEDCAEKRWNREQERLMEET